MTRFLLFLTAILASLSLCAGAGTPQAVASPGALDVLILESQCDPTVPAETLRAEILAQPGVASVNFFDADKAAPTAAQLNPYDVVLAMSDCAWFDQEATGNSLADFQDQGGVVVGAVFDWQATGPYVLGGRWITAGYSPYELGGAAAFTTATLGTHIASNPLLSGVSSLSAKYRDEVSVSPGAQEIAKWSDGLPAVAVKGDAVGINANLGDYEVGQEFSGDFARLIVNAGNLLGRHELVLTKLGDGHGTISSAPAGIECGTICSAAFGNETSVTLNATPTGGSSFAGWSGAGCGGSPTCTVAMSAAVNVTATFDAPPASPAPTVPVAARLASHCIVPNLTGKTLKAGRRAIAKADCKLGRVTKLKGATAKSGLVVSQNPQSGKKLAAGAKVAVKLVPPARPGGRR